MEIKTHFYLIILIIQRSAFSRLIWYLLLTLNILMFVLLFEYNNSLLSRVSKHQDLMENRNELRKLRMPNNTPKLESIKREYFKENVSDDFSIQLYNSMKNKGKNKYASSLISIRRRLRDVRQPGCLKKVYVVPENTSSSSYFVSSNIKKNLPKASVVIIFCNELLTLILRTVWSILNQTPRDLLHEIILVDDGSNETDITEVLPWYIQNRFPNENIRLIQNPTQKHIFGAKLVGARSATGEVIVFLEGHCEVTPGWLEPLLYHVGRNPSAIAIPILDFIEYNTLELRERVCAVKYYLIS